MFNETLDDGQRLLNSRVSLMKTIARIFNDKDTEHVVLKNVDPTNLQVKKIYLYVGILSVTYLYIIYLPIYHIIITFQVDLQSSVQGKTGDNCVIGAAECTSGITGVI